MLKIVNVLPMLYPNKKKQLQMNVTAL